MEILVFNANSIDPDQMSHSAASNLGLHCLPVTHLTKMGEKLLNIFLLQHLTKLPCWLEIMTTDVRNLLKHHLMMYEYYRKPSEVLTSKLFHSWIWRKQRLNLQCYTFVNLYIEMFMLCFISADMGLKKMGVHFWCLRMLDICMGPMIVFVQTVYFRIFRKIPHH